MQRAMTPEKQVNLLEEHLKKSGIETKRTELYELVARLNGAKNWNEMAKPATAQPVQENSFSELVRRVLAPVRVSLQMDNPLAKLPESVRRMTEAVVASLVQVASAAAGKDPKSQLINAAENLKLLRTSCEEAEDLLWKQAGFNRVLQVPEGHVLRVLEGAPWDEESLWTMQHNGEYWEVEPELMDELREKAVVSEAMVQYPRGDKYGVPETATDDGCRAWLWSEGFAVTPDLLVIGEDTGDDSGERMRLTVHLPQELLERIAPTV